HHRGWLLYSSSLGVLLLTTGPAVGSTVLLLPAVLGPVWMNRSGRPALIGWYATLAAAAAVALLPILLWSSLISTELRSVNTANWALPWKGPALLPLLAMSALLYPWPYWPRFWRSARRQSRITR